MREAFYFLKGKSETQCSLYRFTYTYGWVFANMCNMHLGFESMVDDTKSLHKTGILVFKFGDLIS